MDPYIIICTLKNSCK